MKYACYDYKYSKQWNQCNLSNTYGFGLDVTSIGLGYQPIFKLLLSPLRTPHTHTLWLTPRIYIKHFQLPPAIILVISTLLHHICKWSTEVQTERWECGVRGWRGIEVGGRFKLWLQGQVDRSSLWTPKKYNHQYWSQLQQHSSP